MRGFVVCIALAASTVGFSQVLSGAATANNGTGGIFMNLTPTSQNLSVTSFDTFFGAAAGGAFQVQVWTRPGSYVGFEGSNAGWTLTQTINGTSVNTTTLASIVLTNPIALTATQTTGVLLHGITTGNALRYNGTGALPPTTTWFNSDLTMFSAHSRTGTVAFGGTLFTPRTFAGNVHYSAVPEPASMAVLGLGAVALIRRRRRKA